ncbi:MAG: tetratricopeptide repeat protein [Flavobacteriaceae bacterium]
MYIRFCFFQLFIISFLLSCSTSKDKFLNKEYHKLNSKYNVIFNAKQALNFGEILIDQSIEEDFRKIISVEPLGLFDGNLERPKKIPSFTLAEEKATKAIQKHSMNFNGSQKNSQIQKAYFLLGKARYFNLRFSPALEAFEYVLKIYDDKETFLKSKLWREKSNIRLNNNKIAIKNLKLLLPQAIKFQNIYSEINASLAHAYLNIKKEDSARFFISKASTFSKNNDKKVRYSFIHGQLLEKLNMLDSAQRVYNSVLGQGRKVPRLFWIHTKLNALKIQTFKSGINPISITRRLKRNYENFPYLHLIDQFEARYYIDEGFDSLGILSYNKSLGAKSSDIITRKSNYRELSDYFFKKGIFIKSGEYLDSLIQLMNKESFIKKMTEIERRGLDRIINLETIIKKNDSILSIVSMNQKERLNYFNKYIEKITKIDSLKKNKAVTRKGIFRRQKKSQIKFYFYNENQINQGKVLFKSLWGSQPNVDNWNSLSPLISNIINENFKNSDIVKTKNPKVKTAEYYVNLLPKKTEIIDSLKNIRRQAYLDAGLLYREKFLNKEMSIKRLSKLLKLNPNKNQEILALYNLFKLYQTSDSINASKLRYKLIQKYPQSIYTSDLLENQNLQKNKSPINFYNSLHKKFMSQQFLDIIVNKNEYRRRLIGTGLELKFELLIINSIGRLRGINEWEKELKKFLEKYPNSKESPDVKKILLNIKTKVTATKPISKNFKWVIVFSNSSEIDLQRLRVNMISELKKRSEDIKLISVDSYSDRYSFIVVHTENQYPEVDFLLKIWSNLSSFQNNLDNFVALSSEYRQIQKRKTWKLKTN